ncbi:hypothetical protein ACWCPJ_25540 [Streptomyces collinus]|uniref:hypothetical protein n=1 Tax=Streptomyces collinus TaxID=42684 RepID=UPI00368A17E5
MPAQRARSRSQYAIAPIMVPAMGTMVKTSHHPWPPVPLTGHLLVDDNAVHMEER